MHLLVIEKIFKSRYIEPDFAEADLEPLRLSFHKAQWVSLGSAHLCFHSLTAVRLNGTNMQS